jgi:hypothetical protein
MPFPSIAAIGSYLVAKVALFVLPILGFGIFGPIASESVLGGWHMLLETDVVL